MPAFIYVDAGSGEYQYERLHIYGDEHPESGLKIVRVKTLEEAVLTAQKMAEKGDVVTLSPACASFDLYPNFEARGRHFKRLVNEL